MSATKSNPAAEPEEDQSDNEGQSDADAAEDEQKRQEDTGQESPI